MKLLKENIKLKKEEKVVLVTDREKDRVFDAIRSAVKARGNKLSIIRISPDRPSSSPIPQTAKEFNKCDVIIAPTTKSISHSPETYTARHKYGARVASMPGITPEMFIDAMKVNPKDVKKLNDWFAGKFRNAKVVNILTPSGTNLKVDIKGVEFRGDDYGDISGREILNNVPFGEFYGWIAKGLGIVFIDYWKTEIIPKDRAWVYLQKGRIIKWNKGAEPLIKVLKGAGECGLRIVELGIGTNTAFKKPIGNVLQDEKIYGTCHIAFGGHGTERLCSVHIDVIMIRPTIWVDGRKIMEKGKLIK